MGITYHCTEKEYVEAIQKAAIRINLQDWETASAWINIFGSMLFPDDKNKRLSWIFRVFLCTRAASYQGQQADGLITLSESCQKIGQDVASLSEYTDGPEELTSLLFEAQHNDIKLEGKNRIVNGMIVGKVFLRALHSNKSLQEVTDEYHKNSTETVSQLSILRNLWPQFLPMAHYWGAMATFDAHGGLNLRDDISNPDDIFCCQKFRDKNVIDGVAGLVRIAESYLFQGINDIPKRTGPKRPLLDISKMFFVLHPFVTFSALHTK